MAFSHGMNVEDVRTQQTETMNQQDETRTAGQNAEQAVQGFVDSHWWGDDAMRYAQDWQEVTQAFNAIADALEDEGQNLTAQADSQEQCSNS